jgi:hypothetical protein
MAAARLCRCPHSIYKTELDGSGHSGSGGEKEPKETLVPKLGIQTNNIPYIYYTRVGHGVQQIVGARKNGFGGEAVGEYIAGAVRVVSCSSGPFVILRPICRRVAEEDMRFSCVY